jgi:hypothetical protein
LSAVYFTDRDLGRQFPSILRDGGIRVEMHGDHFPAVTPDDEWLAGVAERRWVVVTHDKRIRYKPNERDAVMRSKIALLVIIGRVPNRDLAVNFVNTIDRVETFVDAHEPPFIAKVFRPSPDERQGSPQAPGRVEMWLSHDEWYRQRR